MSELAVLRICAFGCNLQIESPHARIVERAGQYVLPTLPRVRSFDGAIHWRARIEEKDSGLELIADGAQGVPAPTLDSMLPFLIRALDDAVIRNLRGLYAVHAGCVVWRGRAILLPGPTHAGKSSLVAELLRRGATYYSDEYALIDGQGRVHPYPRAVLMRNGSPEQNPMLASEWGAAVGDGPAAVGWIFAVNYQPDGAWKLQPMEQSDSTFALLRNTPHVLAEAPVMLSHFHRAVLGARGFHGVRNDAAEAADRILQIADETAEQE